MSDTSKAAAKRAADRAARRVLKHGPEAKTSFKRNVLPAIAGVGVMLAIMGLLNGQLLVAQWQYRFHKPVVAASASVSTPTPPSTGSDPTKSPHPELGPRVTIPAINVDAPVVFE